MAARGGRDEDRRARGEATRRDLVNAGRALFVNPGYFHTSIGDLVERSGVGTRGAFYHHFSDKATLFRAVFEDVERDLMLRALATPPAGADTWECLQRGLHDFLEAAMEPEVQRIILIDGPVVLGWRTLRSIEERSSIAMIEQIVRNAMADGTIEKQPVSELTHMLVAAVEEGSLLVAHADNPERARRNAAAVLDRMLRSLAPDRQRLRK
ncbi:TetR/AcrR family transcriptional regulator [Mycolicibacterium phlei]